MKHFIKITSIACAIACAGVAFADSSAPATPSAADQAQMQQKLTQLQQQLTQLNQEIAVKSKAQIKKSGFAVINNSNLGKYTAMADQSRRIASTDQGDYFELMPTAFELAMLQGKDTLQGDYHPLVVGGYMETDLQYWNSQHLNATPATSADGSQFGMSQVNVDVLGNPNDWIQIFVSTEGTNLGNTNTQNIVFEKGFVTVGDLNKSPFYITMGKTYLSFGSFGGNGPFTNELSKNLFRSNEMPQVILGFFQDGLAANLSVFSDTYTHSYDPDFSFNLAYTYTINKDWSYNLGASYLNDIRATDSQLGYAFNTANAFSTANGKNPAIDLNGALSYKIYTLSGEYDQTLNDNYTTANVDNGKTRAWFIAGSAAPQLIMSEPTTFQVTYSGASGIKNIPNFLTNNFLNGATANNGLKQSWIFSASQPVLVNWFLGLEYARGRTYENANDNVYTLDSELFF